jgi:hypothetical protein
LKTVRFSHRLNEEVRGISGWYVFTKEGTFMLGPSRVLFLVGHGLVDSACCGFGGCLFALVPGSVIAFKYASDPDGRPVSLVLPITDPERQDRIKSLLIRQEGVSQVLFYTGHTDESITSDSKPARGILL